MKLFLQFPHTKINSVYPQKVVQDCDYFTGLDNVNPVRNRKEKIQSRMEAYV